MQFWPSILLQCANGATQYLQRECGATRLRPQDLVRTALLITYYGKAVQFDPGPLLLCMHGATRGYGTTRPGTLFTEHEHRYSVLTAGMRCNSATDPVTAQEQRCLALNAVMRRNSGPDPITVHERRYSGIRNNSARDPIY